MVAASAACQKAANEQTTGQSVEIVVVEMGRGSSTANHYLTRFANLNRDCAPSGSGSGSIGPVTESFTFTSNVTAALASKIAEDIRATGLFASVTEMTVPPCTSPGLKSGSCTPPTLP
jgi:hypothetical protein